MLSGDSTLPRELKSASILDRASAGAERGAIRFKRGVPLLGPATREIREAGEGGRLLQ